MHAMHDEPSEPALPIFPLPNVVLFPAVAVPLYIFEPRYRQMTADALVGAKRIGMVTVDPRAIAEIAGNPRVFDVGCEGEIVRSESRPDGTYQILLRGLRRFRIRREIPPSGARLYRAAEIEPLDDPSPRDIGRARGELLELMQQLLPDRADEFRSAQFDEVDDTQFVNAFCQAIELPPLEKQKLLEANGVSDRIDALVSLLRFRLAEHGASGGDPPKTVH